MKRDDTRHVDAVLGAVRSSSRAAQSPVAASWCRSALYHGLDPAGDSKRDRLDSLELLALRDRNVSLLSVAMPVLDQLFRSVDRSGCGVILADKQGVVLERRASDSDAAYFSEVGLTPGGRWAEADEGTNGIGTCLFEGRPVVIHRDQHFASRNIGISCMDAPVYDPHGRLIAALDITSCRDDHNAAVADMVGSLVRQSAHQIERDFFYRHFAGVRVMFVGEDPFVGSLLLAVDRDDIIVGASRAARISFGLTDEIIETARPVAEILGEDAGLSFHDGERGILRRALAQADGNASHAARLLGIGRATFYRRLKRAGLN